jgi:predicted secreted protein
MLTINVTDATEPTPIRINVGTSVLVCLDENPSTGFLWERVSNLPKELKERRCDFACTSSGIGSAGRRCFEYLSKRPQTVRVEFALRRPWDRAAFLKKTTIELSWNG